MSEAQPNKRRRRRRRKKKPPSDSPIAAKPKLDLKAPAQSPLSEEEIAESRRHLAFLKQYKGVLRLTLNATEDLLVNGAKAPEERGVLKHLLKKVDKNAVAHALDREPLKSAPMERVRFLSGVVRIDPSIGVLLSYLEALAEGGDRREAARALDLTVKRVDFGAASEAQLERLAQLVTGTFEGHDLVQAVLGLVRSASFDVERVLPRLSDTDRDLFASLGAAERVILRGHALPEDEAGRARVDAGAERLLSAPDRVLRSHAEPVRIRLAERAMQRAPLGTAVRTLVDSLPHEGDRYADLALAWSEKLLAGRHDDRARGVLEQIVQSHPKRPGVQDRLTALAWERVDRVAIMPGKPSEKLAVKRGFWLDGSAFVWVRTGEPNTIAVEFELQKRATMPNVVPALAAGPGWVAMLKRGRPLALDGRVDAAFLPQLLRDGLTIIKTLALYGVELPDAQPSRFALVGKGALVLFDFTGAIEADPNQADIAASLLAGQLIRGLLSSCDAPGDLSRLTERRLPIPMMLEMIDRTAARRSPR